MSGMLGLMAVVMPNNARAQIFRGRADQAGDIAGVDGPLIAQPVFGLLEAQRPGNGFAFAGRKRDSLETF